MAPQTPSQVAKTLIGMTEANAVAAIQAAGFISKVISVDGVASGATCDMLRNRINLTLDGGVVTETSVG